MVSNAVWTYKCTKYVYAFNESCVACIHTRSKTKALKEAMNALVLKVATKSELQGPLEYQEETLIHLIHLEEGSNTTLFGP